LIPMTDFFYQVHIGHQVNWLLVVLSPPSHG
jgi:hypothetical protein